jgi:hypothetical protein
MRISIFFFLIVIISIACRRSNENKTLPEKSSFVPYGQGTYWVFKDSEGYVDTLKVMKLENTNEGIKVDLNSQKWLVKSNDSIFVRCQTRGGRIPSEGAEFVMPLFIKTKDNIIYNTCLGDVVTEVVAQRLMGPQVVNEKAYIDCTEYFIKPYTKIIVADKVGPIKYTYLDLGGEIKSERNLIDFKVVAK